MNLRLTHFLLFLLWLYPNNNHARALKLQLAEFSNARDAGWETWSPRSEIAPKCYVDQSNYRSAPTALAIAGNNNPAAYGGWIYRTGGILPGRNYLLTAYYRASNVSHEELRVVARLDWQDAKRQRTGYPDYAYVMQPAGDWKKLTLQAPAPENATQALIELSLGWSPRGTVWWDDISLEEVPAKPPRAVRIGSVSLRPRQTGGKDEASLRS
jgi:hypothetical protein